MRLWKKVLLKYKDFIELEIKIKSKNNQIKKEKKMKKQKTEKSKKNNQKNKNKKIKTGEKINMIEPKSKTKKLERNS